MKRKICVIGCGWLGFPLAKSLFKKGYRVSGSTTSPEKISVLNSSNIQGFLIQISSEGIIGDIKDCLAECETLIVNIPPGLRKNPEANYVKQMQFLIPFVEDSSVKNVLFVSSTSVYDDTESFPVISEISETSSVSKTAQQLLAVEANFQKNLNFKTTIIRFSGLFGEDRHPAKHLSGRQNIKNPAAPVNLIHLIDCISIIENIIQHGIWNTTFNASTTPHPSKETYYLSVCKRLNLTLPEFDQSQVSKGKTIDSTKLAQVLGYEFKIKL